MNTDKSSLPTRGQYSLSPLGLFFVEQRLILVQVMLVPEFQEVQLRPFQKDIKNILGHLIDYLYFGMNNTYNYY